MLHVYTRARSTLLRGSNEARRRDSISFRVLGAGGVRKFCIAFPVLRAHDERVGSTNCRVCPHLAILINTLAVWCICFAAMEPCRADTPAQLNKMLMDAAKTGDVDLAKTALRSGADPNARVDGTWLNFTPLLQAASEGHAEVAQVLLEAGADPRLEDENDDPSLVFATERKKEALARLLIAYGVGIDEPNSEGLSPFVRQLDYAPLEDLEFMLELGADPNQRTDGGVAPLMKLARTTMLDEKTRASTSSRLQLLLRHGARINDQDDDGDTALLTAASSGDSAMVNWLVEAGADIERPNHEGTTPLLAALASTDGRSLYLIERGARVDARDNEGTTTLMVAATVGRLDMVRLLLARGVDPTAKTKNGWTAVHAAAGSMFAAYGPIEKMAPTPLRLVQILKVLQEAGANLNAATGEEETPLHVAAHRGYYACLTFLLSRGCDPNAATRTGETPLFRAVAAEPDALRKIKALVAKGGRVSGNAAAAETPLMRAAALTKLEIAEYLLKKGADVGTKNSVGESALPVAASVVNTRSVDAQAYLAMLRLLLGHRAAVDERNARGMTPLMCAAAGDMRHAVTLLRKAGADIHARSRDGRTPLMWAASCGAVSTVNLLLDAGADPAAVDTLGRTALQWANDMNQRAVIGLPVWQKQSAAAR